MIGLDPGTVTETLECLAEDVRFDAIKVGMLGDGAVAAAVMGWLEGQKNVPVALDPVMKSSSGKDLLDPEGCEILRREGLVRASWITPNLAELAALAGREIPAIGEETENLARELRMAASLGNPMLKIVVTGGHAKTPDDLLLVNGKFCWFRGERVETNSTHGTGVLSRQPWRLGLRWGMSLRKRWKNQALCYGCAAATQFRQGWGMVR